jgi:hypothetical protein
MQLRVKSLITSVEGEGEDMQHQDQRSFWRNWQIKVRINSDLTFTSSCPQFGLEFTRPTMQEADEALLRAMTEIFTAEFQAQHKARYN